MNFWQFMHYEKNKGLTDNAERGKEMARKIRPLFHSVNKYRVTQRLQLLATLLFNSASSSSAGI